ncbi:MAG TPA: bacteriohemerythrin [Rhodocyclaceae bacterium]
MALISWSPMLSTGVQEIDDQHKKLIDLVNKLNDAMHAGQGKEALGSVLGELVKYTVYHFGTEERLMGQHKYAESAAHMAEHKKLIQDVSAFKTKFDGGNAMISTELMNFLRDWLSKHIMQTDKKFGKALNTAGVK